jgi:FkbM family methyltransferase
MNVENRFSKRFNREFLWPVEDKGAWKWLNNLEHWDLPIQISDLCKDRNLVIQAGGNAGLYTKIYSSLFSSVITFEPDHTNFYCLSNNVTEQNVFKFQSLLGNSYTPMGLEYNPLWHEKNCGAVRVAGDGLIPQVTIDSFNLLPNLIHLDIEGFEAFALLGAESTIKRCHPIIALETNGSGDNYGWPQEKIDNLLFSWGYSIIKKWEHDTVYGYTNT